MLMVSSTITWHDNQYEAHGSRREWTMSYEYAVGCGVLRVLKIGSRWGIEFNGHRCSCWTSPDDAVMAAVRHSTGGTRWDRSRLVVPDDLLRWRPIGENL